VVKLPKSRVKRLALRSICQDFCDQRDAELMPDKDWGESHTFICLA
jgi:hypothetical protein